MYAMLTGATLLIFAVAARLLARSAIHPSVAMPITWGLGLIGVSLASLIGFYRVESDALLIFLFANFSVWCDVILPLRWVFLVSLQRLLSCAEFKFSVR